MTIRHWLVDVLVQAQIDGAEMMSTELGVSVSDAWEGAREACGVDDEEIAQAIAAFFRLEVADPNQAQPNAADLVPERLAREHNVFALREDDRNVIVATSDPMNFQMEGSLAFATGRKPVFEVAPPHVVHELINTHYAPDRAVQQLIGTLYGTNLLNELGPGEGDADSVDSIRVVQEVGPETVAAEEVESAPVIKLSNLILRDAIAQRASDIHIEPGRHGGTVRFRVDGVLRRYMQMPMPAFNRIVSRLKILGELDISDRLRPQDGRVRIGLNDHNYDLRISTVPTRDAEKMVIRILDPEVSVGLDALGVPADDERELRRLLSHREGLILVTGPTGSGKTTTLYSCLRALATGEVNIMTIEDPIEYELPGVTQMQVEPRRGFTFGTALRSILRQDPDVIFVGEIRDLETAEIAVQASMTGHLVLATLHTNDAVGVVQRLVDLGLDRSSLAEALLGSLAQRLIRCVCTKCAQPVADDMTEEEERLMKVYGVTPVVRAVGCPECGDSGYHGRMPVLELAAMGPRIRDTIARGATSAELSRAVRSAGMRPLRDAAIDRVRDGTTTLQEVDRVVGEPLETTRNASEATRILLVDDDAAERTLARLLLEKNEFEVVEASDGAAALELLADGIDFSLMLLDLEMPGLDGREVLRGVRGTVRTAGLPVVVLTGAEDPEVEVELMNAGADDYLRKPIDPPRFVARIKAALRRAGS